MGRFVFDEIYHLVVHRQITYGYLKGMPYDCSVTKSYSGHINEEKTKGRRAAEYLM